MKSSFFSLSLYSHWIRSSLGNNGESQYLLNINLTQGMLFNVEAR